MRRRVSLLLIMTLGGCAHSATSVERFVDGEIQAEREERANKAVLEARKRCLADVSLIKGADGSNPGDYKCNIPR
jgi:hypothetical protein